MKRIFLTMLMISLFFLAKSQQMEPAGYGPVPRGFIENKGQIRDEKGKPNHDVKYIFNHGAFNLELRKNGFSYEIFTVIPDQDPDEAGFVHDAEDRDAQSMKRIASSQRVDVEFSGVNQKTVPVASNQNQVYYNYYFAPISSNRFEHVRSFQTVTYKDLYPGIDLVFTAPEDADDTLKYEFIIQPGVDASQIRMKYKGLSQVSLNENGLLHVPFANGFVDEGKVNCFLQNSDRPVDSRISIFKNTVVFSIAEFDKTKTLVIDPSIVWGTYFGGENTEDVSDVSVDKMLNPSIGGNTLSTTSIATSGAYQSVYAGGFFDLFVAKFNSTAQIQWATYLGGTERDVSFALGVDHYNNVYIGGKTNSDGLATSGAYQATRGGIDDAILAKFDPTGGIVWSTYFGGTDNDEWRDIQFDNENHFYTCGYTESSAGIATSGAWQEAYGGAGDGDITKWNLDGSVVWSTYYGGPGQDRYHVLNIDLQGNVYLCGTTGSVSGVTTSGAYQTLYGGGGEDMWLSKFTKDDHLVWSTYFGGSLDDRGRGVVTDSTDGVYIAGFTDSQNGISTPGAVQPTWSAGYDTFGNPYDDGFIGKFDSSGHRIWATYYGGNNKEDVWGMNLDRRHKAIYIVGDSQSDSLIAYGNAFQPVKDKGSDCIFARWNYDGTILWGSYWGSDNGQQFEDVDIDSLGYIYLAGKSETSQLPPTYGVYQTHNNGGTYDGILYKFYGGAACLDLNEPNNTFAKAKSVYAKSSDDSLVYGYDGNLRNSNDKDYFKLKVTSGYKNIFVELTNLVHNYDLKMYNANQVLKAQSTNTGSTPDTIIANHLQPGVYYIQVVAAPPVEFDTLNCYHLNIIKSNSKFGSSGGQSKVMESETAELKIFPNPASSDITLELSSDDDEIAELRITDLLGRVIKSEEISLTNGLQNIQMSLLQMPSGIYQVSVHSPEKTWVNLIVKN